ncbi:nitrite reductase small subunit NirD [Psychromonas ossibalaenae]|uniref:nitrite reductase small subunit NirD n=1 Tax=Psychromonas ossibalaenae TaxID=444922 RepID=UPI00036489A3|nr:nitrite reductase small subunit NirD [Psychromonas ossibalaenae]
MSQWITICKHQELSENSGVCALFEGQQVAVFYCKRNADLYAVSNFDPIAQANVISRGIMGSVQEQAYVASPLYKQRFDLNTGICIDSPEFALKTYLVRIEADQVQLKKAG